MLLQIYGHDLFLVDKTKQKTFFGFYQNKKVTSYYVVSLNIFNLERIFQLTALT